jgi:hypothetical protein
MPKMITRNDRRTMKRAIKKIRATKEAPRPATTGREAVSEFNTLRTLIGDFAQAAIAESWKGGGDPAEMPVFEAQLKLAEIKLDSHIKRMERGDFV